MSNFKIPVVIIHRGDSEYLPATILQLRYSNPSVIVYLLGDEKNKHYGKIVKHYAIADFFERAKTLERIYVHHSTNGYEFELICIQRWFVLNDFMKRMNISKCVYLDSDVLVYSDTTDVQKKLDIFAMTVTGISAHTNFINDREVLNDFCQFIWNAYEKERSTSELRNRYDEFLKVYPAGGISDMTFFSDYRTKHPGKIGDLAEIRDKTVFDITLDTITDYESENGYKKLVWKDKLPHALHLKSLEYIGFHTLHFQGKCKPKIYQFTAYSFTFFISSLLWRMSYYGRKIAQKLR